MSFWKKLGTALLVAFDILVDANDQGLVKIKELEKAKKARDIIKGRIPLPDPNREGFKPHGKTVR